MQGNLTQTAIGGILLSLGKIWELDPDFLVNQLEKLSSSKKWQKREIAIQLLKQSLMHRSDYFVEHFINFADSDDIYKRRVAISTAKEIAILAGQYDNLKLEILILLAPFVFENDQFVSRMVVDAFANGFVKYCINDLLPWIEMLLPFITHKKHKMLILRFFATKIPENHLFRVLTIIEEFMDSNDNGVINSRHSTIRSLAIQYPQKVGAWLENRLDIDGIINHWAVLELDSIIPSILK